MNYDNYDYNLIYSHFALVVDNYIINNLQPTPSVLLTLTCLGTLYKQSFLPLLVG